MRCYSLVRLRPGSGQTAGYQATRILLKLKLPLVGTVMRSIYDRLSDMGELELQPS